MAASPSIAAYAAEGTIVRQHSYPRVRTEALWAVWSCELWSRSVSLRRPFHPVGPPARVPYMDSESPRAETGWPARPLGGAVSRGQRAKQTTDSVEVGLVEERGALLLGPTRARKLMTRAVTCRFYLPSVRVGILYAKCHRVRRDWARPRPPYVYPTQLKSSLTYRWCNF